LPGDRVNLFGSTHGEVVLSEYDGEARIIQEPDVSDLVGHEVVFVCETGAVAGEVLSAAKPGTLVIDLVGCGASRAEIPLVHVDINPDAVTPPQCVVAVPHALSAILAEVLHPLDRDRGIEGVTAVVLRPAVDFGDEGLEELREQTVRLLNFTSVPVEVFGRQLCFNVIPDRLTEERDSDLRRRIEGEVSRILGWPEERLALRLVTVPVFHGHTIVLNVRLGGEAAADEIISAYDGLEGIRGPEPGDALTPLEAAGTRRTYVSEVTEDGLGGFWLWVVAGELESVPGQQAVRLARALREL
jgi:aspartate-semialdehyde dehydrogenase